MRHWFDTRDAEVDYNSLKIFSSSPGHSKIVLLLRREFPKLYKYSSSIVTRRYLLNGSISLKGLIYLGFELACSMHILNIISIIIPSSYRFRYHTQEIRVSSSRVLQYCLLSIIDEWRRQRMILCCYNERDLIENNIYSSLLPASRALALLRWLPIGGVTQDDPIF